MEDTFKDLLKEAYEQGCPFCNTPGFSLFATKQIVLQGTAEVDEDGSLQDFDYDTSVEQVVTVDCSICQTDLYVNGDWVAREKLEREGRQLIVSEYREKLNHELQVDAAKPAALLRIWAEAKVGPYDVRHVKEYVRDNGGDWDSITLEEFLVL